MGPANSVLREAVLCNVGYFSAALACTLQIPGYYPPLSLSHNTQKTKRRKEKSLPTENLFSKGQFYTHLSNFAVYQILYVSLLKDHYIMCWLMYHWLIST